MPQPQAYSRFNSGGVAAVETKVVVDADFLADTNGGENAFAVNAGTARHNAPRFTCFTVSC